jgi:hypothetical protein
MHDAGDGKFRQSHRLSGPIYVDDGFFRQIYVDASRLAFKRMYTVPKIRQCRGDFLLYTVAVPNIFCRQIHFMIYSVLLPNIRGNPRHTDRFLAQCTQVISNAILAIIELCANIFISCLLNQVLVNKYGIQYTNCCFLEPTLI